VYHAKEDCEDNVALSDTCQLAQTVASTFMTGLVYGSEMATISEKVHSGVLHYLWPNRSSKLCRNAFDRLRISDARLLPAFQILTL
jgi:hypothetical protein